MYRSLLTLSQEDAANGNHYGLRHLVTFFQTRLSKEFDKGKSAQPRCIGPRMDLLLKLCMHLLNAWGDGDASSVHD
jgi:hypothetical protein